MNAALIADALVWLHFGFIVFVVAGAGLLFAWPRVVWLHLPACLWGAYIEFAGTICPLTPLELRYRLLAGEHGYAGGFVEHYLLPLIYPGDLTRAMQIGLGAAVLAINLALYGLWIWRRRRAAGQRLRKKANRPGIGCR